MLIKHKKNLFVWKNMNPLGGTLTHQRLKFRQRYTILIRYFMRSDPLINSKICVHQQNLINSKMLEES